MHHLSRGKLPAATASTVAAGALRIRVYTRCGYCSDHALTCNEKEPVERLLAGAPIEKSLGDAAFQEAETAADRKVEAGIAGREEA